MNSKFLFWLLVITVWYCWLYGTADNKMNGIDHNADINYDEDLADVYSEPERSAGDSGHNDSRGMCYKN